MTPAPLFPPSMERKPHVLFTANDAPNPKPVVNEEPKKSPKPLFGDQGFQSNKIDPDVRKWANDTSSTLDDIELARVTYILEHDMKNIEGGQAVFTQIEQMQQATSRSNTLLLEALNTDIINDINSALNKILSTITNSSNHESHISGYMKGIVAWIEGAEIEDERSMKVSTIDTVNKLIRQITEDKIPSAEKVKKKLADVLYYANTDHRQLSLYYAAGQVKIMRLEAVMVDPETITDAKKAMIERDRRHHIGLFKRRIDSVNSHMAAVMMSIMQAQTIQHTLDNMLLDVTESILISVPAYINQLKFMSTMSDLKDSQIMKEFDKQRLAVIKDLNNAIIKK